MLWRAFTFYGGSRSSCPERRRRCARIYGRALRIPPFRWISCSSSSNRRRIKTMFGVHPRSMQATDQSPNVRCPLALLHRRQAATSFSNQLGPPLIRGTTCSVVGRTKRLSNGRRHHTHSAPSRCKIRARRAARFRWGLGCLDEATSPPKTYCVVTECVAVRSRYGTTSPTV